MLRPVSMKRVLVLIPRSRVDAVLEAVGALGILHPVAASDVESWPRELRSGADPPPASRQTESLRRLETIARLLGLPGAEAMSSGSEPARPPGGAPSPEEIDAWIAAWSSRSERLRSEHARWAREIEELERAAAAVRSLARSGVELARLRQATRLHARCGWIDASERARLGESLARVPHRLVEADSEGRQQLILAFCPSAEGERLERALRSTGFAALDVAAFVPEGCPDAAEAIGSRLREANERRRSVGEEIERLRREIVEPLARARRALERERALAEARVLAGRSEAVALLGGWIPEETAEALEHAVRGATDGRCQVHVDAPDSLASVRDGKATVPVLLRNARQVRPFERLVAAYGAPRWRELDPTSFVAVAFWTMFGLMFGDVGHGALLAAAGAWIVRRRPRLREYGLVAVQCGLASIAFGFAYGSVFGYEGWLPALWLHPMRDPERLLRAGAGFGLVFLSLALGLGVVNTALRRDWDATLLGSHGLLVALAYWTAAVAGLRWLASGETGLGGGLAAAGIALPLALWWAGNVAGERRWRGAPEERASLPGTVFRSSIEVVDLVVRGLANTVSFVRLAAFAVAHAGLLLAVFSIAEAISGPGRPSAGGVAVLVLGNLLVVGLEGLIVSIQTVRLIYYEFFSRFHEGSGLPYRPLDLRAEAGQREVP